MTFVSFCPYVGDICYCRHECFYEARKRRQMMVWCEPPEGGVTNVWR